MTNNLLKWLLFLFFCVLGWADRDFSSNLNPSWWSVIA